MSDKEGAENPANAQIREYNTGNFTKFVQRYLSVNSFAFYLSQNAVSALSVLKNCVMLNLDYVTTYKVLQFRQNSYPE
jgi:hypothetical protein